MPTRVEVELDLFSGMPNPTWVLANAEADSFVTQVAALALTSATELSGNLGYRGFMVQVMQGTGSQTIRVQTGTVHISTDATTVFARDENRELEKWLLNAGKPYLDRELFLLVEREFR